MKISEACVSHRNLYQTSNQKPTPKAHWLQDEGNGDKKKFKLFGLIPAGLVKIITNNLFVGTLIYFSQLLQLLTPLSNFRITNVAVACLKFVTGNDVVVMSNLDSLKINSGARYRL